MKGIRGMDMEKKESRTMRAVKLWTGAALAAFLAAASLYLVLIWIEKKELETQECQEIYVAIKSVPGGQIITAENVNEYFEKKAVDVTWIPEAALREEGQLTRRVVRSQIEQGAFPTEGMFSSLDEITAGMREPVIAGFQAEDLSQVAGGVLRAGDRIHVYASEEGQGTFLIWENVYVQQVFDAGGAAIESGDQTTAAQRVNVFLDKEDVESFYTRLDQGSLRVVKIWREASKEG